MIRLQLDEAKIRRARRAAARIADRVQHYIERHTTTATERTVLRLLGVDGVDEEGVPLPNVLVDQLRAAGRLGGGAARVLASGMLRHDLGPQELAQAVAEGRIDFGRIAPADEGAVRELAGRLADEACARIRQNRAEREARVARLGDPPTPWLYLIVATGNIYEDVVQAQAAVLQGADVVAIIRSTAQSLLDYVPYGATTEGFAGTFATQENFRIMRRALDEASEQVGRYIRQVNYCSGLCMPEIAAMGALERLDMMLNDSMYGILFRDINMKRTLVDQHFSRAINAYAGIIINTGEDNYLTTDDMLTASHTVLASQFINEQLALRSGMPEELMGLGHAFEMDPDLEDSFVLQLADAAMTRQIFARHPLKYMPPTRHMTGNIFKGHLMDAMFNLVSVMTGQHIHLLGMLTEAIHTPHLADRYLSIENARYIMGTARHLADSLQVRAGGLLEKRAAHVLDAATEMLEEIESIGLMEAISRGMFARVKRQPDGGKGRDGVAERAPDYWNPFLERMVAAERAAEAVRPR